MWQVGLYGADEKLYRTAAQADASTVLVGERLVAVRTECRHFSAYRRGAATFQPQRVTIAPVAPAPARC